MNSILSQIIKHNGIKAHQLCNILHMKSRTVSSRLTGLKHRGIICNGYHKWYYAKNIIELDNNQIEITLHNNNIEIWDCN